MGRMLSSDAEVRRRSSTGTASARWPSIMTDAWVTLGRLNADLLAIGAESVIFGWALLAAGAAWASWAPVQRASDLKVLGLDCIPSSRDELRRAYRRAAKATHPDAGGSATAFRAVTEAFERLAGKHALKV